MPPLVPTMNEVQIPGTEIKRKSTGPIVYRQPETVDDLPQALNDFVLKQCAKAGGYVEELAGGKLRLTEAGRKLVGGVTSPTDVPDPTSGG